jgi:phospholipase/carboxylesterase
MSNRLSKRSRDVDASHPLDWMGSDGLFTPQGYEPGYDYPLVVWLPDRSRRFDIGRAMKRLSLRNFVAIAPDFDPSMGQEPLWDAIDCVCDRASIHPQRIYLVGQGSGGTEAFRIACRNPAAFAGVVSLGGAFPLDEGLFARLADVRRLPMLLCCRRTTSPDVARHTDRTLRVFHAAGAMLAMRIYPGSNDLSKAILADVNRWLMDEVCGTSALVPTTATP